jgi:ubiquitin C-terminal hydrolase
LAFDVHNRFVELMRQAGLPGRSADTLRLALYRAGLQHDAGNQHEDVAAGVSKLVACLSSASADTSHAFNGTVRSVVTCHYRQCGHVGDKADPTAVFTIPTSKTQELQACIDVAFGGDNAIAAYDCPRHRRRGPATITYAVAQAPAIIVLDLANPVVSRQGVRFGNTIRFGPDAQQFDLVAAIWRTGASTQLGHFVAVCRYGSAWFVMNDGHISQVESAQSTSPPLPGAAVKMLFYCSTESGVAAAAKATGAKRRLFFGHS